MKSFLIALAAVGVSAAVLAADPAKPAASDASALEPAVRTSDVAAAPAPAKSSAKDRIQLDTTQVTGNRELPRVMYVVPWRKPDLGEFAGRPPNSLLDEALTPVDRDVFKRQNRYYAALQPDAAAAKSQDQSQPAALPAATPKDEK